METILQGYGIRKETLMELQKGSFTYSLEGVNSIKSRDFFLGGHALFTVSNPQGSYYTYKIQRPEGRSPRYFVNLLTGPDNESSYTYLGILDPGSFDFRLTRASRLGIDTAPVKVLRWALTIFRNGNRPPAGYAVQHQGKCCRCGRTLTTPESIDRGIGPDCYERGLS